MSEVKQQNDEIVNDLNLKVDAKSEELSSLE